MKSKQIKVLRKKLEKIKRSGFELPKGVAVTNDNAALTLHSWSPADLKTKKRLPEFLALFEENMGEQYRKSSWGLNMEEKHAELSHSNARFLVLLQNGQDLAGFCHYRLDYDDEESPTDVVLYVYELQLHSSFQRQGLGKQIMAVVEQIAVAMELSKVMLTVFQSNQGALQFYRGIQYDIDESSPSRHGAFADYEILSKKVM